MQLTPDQSTVGNPAESIQFSVRWGEEECLIGAGRALHRRRRDHRHATARRRALSGGRDAADRLVTRVHR
ncbi:DUF6993 domain-containing protein [Microbacterium sp. NRRL B-14842]|uniref:DUF6993 domain-containing protein n=1 Tax=Microbacterium sp. NRRL B-14842 TaxID=3162881 RepID=UPI003D29CF8C